MEQLDKLNVEQMVKDEDKCPYRIMLKEYFQYDIPVDCQYRKMLKTYFRDFSAAAAHDMGYHVRKEKQK